MTIPPSITKADANDTASVCQGTPTITIPPSITRADNHDSASDRLGTPAITIPHLIAGARGRHRNRLQSLHPET